MLSGPRNTPTRAAIDLVLPLAAGAVIYQGGMVCADAAGLAIAGKTAAGLVVVGMAQISVRQADGDESVFVRPGTYLFGSLDGADQIGQAQIGRVVYLVDDETLAATNGGGTRSPAGVVIDVEPAGVWVKIGPAVRQA